MACDLGDDRRNLGLQREHGIVDEEAANAPEIDRAEEILQIEIENETPPPVHFGVGDDGAAPIKTMRGKPKPPVSFLFFMDARIEQFGKAGLKQGKLWLRGMNRAHTARFLEDIEGAVFFGRVHLVEDVANALRGEAKQLGKVCEALCLL